MNNANARNADGGKIWRQLKDNLVGYLFISPWLIGFLVLTLGTMIYSLVLSFFRADMMSDAVYVGIQNYERLFRDKRFWKSLINTVYYTASVPAKVVVGLIVAMVLNRELPGIRLFRTIYYLPAVVSGVAVAILWQWLLHPDFGLVNAVLGYVGVNGPGWLATEEWAMPGLILMSFWSVGSTVVIYLAGLQGVPRHLYEAAEIDGAGAWAKFRAVTFPMVSPTLFFSLITGLIGSFQIFLSTFVMTEGGPNNATLTLVLYLYRQAFLQFRMGYASALAWIIFVLILVLSLFLFRSSALWVYYEGLDSDRR